MAVLYFYLNIAYVRTKGVDIIETYSVQMDNNLDFALDSPGAREITK